MTSLLLLKTRLTIVLFYSCMEMICHIKLGCDKVRFHYHRKVPRFVFESRYQCRGNDLWLVNRYDVPLKKVTYYTGSATLANILLYQQQLYWAKTHTSTSLSSVVEKKWRKRETVLDRKPKSWG